MIVIDVVFYLTISLLLSSYILYPLFLSVFKLKRKKGHSISTEDTHIHVIIACYNEEAVIVEKIQNSNSIKYPRPHTVYVIIDKSDDKTSELAHQQEKIFSNLIVIDKGYRKGKNDSINYFYKQIEPKDNDVLFFTDANTFYQDDSFINLWARLIKGNAVVGGSMKYIDKNTNSAKSEGLYWKYEEWIRKNESKMSRTITMNGGNMAMFAKFFEELPLFVPNDFDIPVRLVSKYQTSFAPDSFGIEKAIEDTNEELDRKKRMANRQMNAILLRWRQVDFVTKWQLLFHKIIRYMAIPLLVLSNLCLLLKFIIYRENLMFLLAFLFAWVIVFISILLIQLKLVRMPILNSIHYAFYVHLYAWIGARKAILGVKTSLWSKASSNRS